MFQIIKDYANLLNDISNINTYIVEYYGENYVLFTNKYLS
jgi:hypothetical protein